MNVIENFAELSAKEQLDFATALVKTINSENTFTDQTNFKVTDVEADEMTGGLIIRLNLEDTVEIEREAAWQAAVEEDAAYEKPTRADTDFFEDAWDDAKKVFKTLTTELEGYNITLEIEDVDTGEITEVDVDTVSEKDSGIGHYEYFGYKGYDSHPYLQVEGTLTQACTIYPALYVEVADHFQAEADED
jgi:hypothetical protein